MSNLRSKLIRLAHAKPELRKDLLPLLAKSAASGIDLKIDEKQKKLLLNSLHRIWEGIAYDYLSGCSRGRCKGDEVQEAVGERTNYMTGEAKAIFHGLTRVEQAALLEEAFPRKRVYGS